MLISLISALGIAILFLHLDQTSWAALIGCSDTIIACNGTSDDDIIYGSSNGNVIHGLGGNDYIISYGSAYRSSIINGDEGNDILIGSDLNDVLYGGIGNDYYDGGRGDDTISEALLSETGIVASDNDVISGGEGDDFIDSGLGADMIHSGPGNDQIMPDGYHRDFSIDTIDCGSDNDRLFLFYSSDGDTQSNCETVNDQDG